MNSAPAAILLNDQPLPLPEPPTLLSVLAGQGLAERRGLAAAVNGDVVPRSAWASHPLVAGDRVLLIRATQGG